MKILRVDAPIELPDGSFFPVKTIFKTEAKPNPACAVCKKELQDNETCYFCKLSLKFFCLECYSKEPTICMKYCLEKKGHVDLLGVLNG